MSHLINPSTFQIEEFQLARQVHSANCDMNLSEPPGDREQEATFKVAQKILRYLNENPNAADTVDGILEWWLLKQSMVDDRPVVERALSALLARDLIRAVHSADSRRHYQLNVDRLEECRKFLRSGEDEN